VGRRGGKVSVKRTVVLHQKRGAKKHPFGGPSRALKRRGCLTKAKLDKTPRRAGSLTIIESQFLEGSRQRFFRGGERWVRRTKIRITEKGGGWPLRGELIPGGRPQSREGEGCKQVDEP